MFVCFWQSRTLLSRRLNSFSISCLILNLDLWLAQTVNHLFFIHQEPHRDQYLTSTTFRFENIYCTQNNKYICIHVQIYYMTFVYYVIASFFRGGRLFCFSLFRMTMKFWHLGCVKPFYGENTRFAAYLIFPYTTRSAVTTQARTKRIQP